MDQFLLLTNVFSSVSTADIANMICLLQFLVFVYSHRPVYSHKSNICKDGDQAV